MGLAVWLIWGQLTLVTTCDRTLAPPPLVGTPRALTTTYATQDACLAALEQKTWQPAPFVTPTGCTLTQTIRLWCALDKGEG